METQRDKQYTWENTDQKEMAHDYLVVITLYFCTDILLMLGKSYKPISLCLLKLSPPILLQTAQ